MEWDTPCLSDLVVASATRPAINCKRRTFALLSPGHRSCGKLTCRLQPSGGGMNAPRKLAAILAADVAGYSRLTGLDEEGTLKRLRKLRRELINPAVSLNRGRIVKTTGDGILIEFRSVVDAMRCALDVQRGMNGRNAHVPTEQRIEFRVGINVG